MKMLGLVLCSLLASCARTPQTRDQLIGTYVAKVGRGSDSMLLKSDGTFDESLRLANGKSFANHGTWKLLDDGSIDLENAFILSSAFPPTSAVGTEGWVVPVHWRPTEFGADEYVWFVKEPESK
jgi:hypothetical protein